MRQDWNSDFSTLSSTRQSLRRAGALAGLALLLARGSQALLSPKGRLLPPSPLPPPSRASEPGLPTLAHVSGSTVPTLDEGTAQRMAAAMLTYSALEVRGGWPTLPATAAKLAPGARGPDVALLRQRLAMTEDLAAEKISRRRLRRRGGGGGAAFPDSPRPAGDRQRRPDHARRAQRAGRQAAASARRLARPARRHGFARSAQRYVVVNIPSTVAEAVEGDQVVRRYVVVVGKTDRPSPTLTTMITTVNLNPTWTVPLVHRQEGHHHQDAQGPGLSGPHAHAPARRPGQRDRSRTPSTGIPTARPTSPCGRIPAPGMRSAPCASTCRIRIRSTCTTPTTRTCSATTTASNPPAARGSPRCAISRPGCCATIRAGAAREIDAGIEKGQRQDIRLTHKIPVAWIYLTGWATRDGIVHFRDDIYGLDDKPAQPLTAEAHAPQRPGGGARLGLRAAIGRHPAVRGQAGLLSRQPVTADASAIGRLDPMRTTATALMLAACAAVPALANDTSAELATGGLIFVQNDNVEMRSEDLAISAKQVDVRYRFFNKSASDVTVLVAFPMPEVRIEEQDQNIALPTEDPVNILGFTTTVERQAGEDRRSSSACSPPASIAPNCCTSLGIPLAPHLAATNEALDRLPPRNGTSSFASASPRSRNTTSARAWQKHLAPRWGLQHDVLLGADFRGQGRDHRSSIATSRASAARCRPRSARPHAAKEAWYDEYKRKYCLDNDFFATIDRLRKAAKSEFGPPYSEERIDYILRTGANWSGPIKRVPSHRRQGRRRQPGQLLRRGHQEDRRRPSSR